MQDNSSLYCDVLGCVYRFVLEHACDRSSKGLEPLNQNYIIRSKQSLANIPLNAEYCILTHISQSLHGKPCHDYQPNINCSLGDVNIIQTMHHGVQIDFYNTPVSPDDNRAYLRAQKVALIANSTECSSIFYGYNPKIGCLYSDTVLNFSELDQSHQIRHRYSVTLYLTELVSHQMPIEFIDGARVILKDIAPCGFNEDK